MDSVYILHHCYEDETHKDTKLIGVFTSNGHAEKAVEMMRSLPGFRDCPEGFVVDEYKLNEINWAEGFGA